MSVLGAIAHTRRRFAAGTRATDGRYTAGSSTDATIYGSAQPAPGRDLERLPEGQRSRKAYRFYTEDSLRTVEQSSGLPADHVQIDSAWYEVIQISPQTAILPHTRALCLAVAESL